MKRLQRKLVFCAFAALSLSVAQAESDKSVKRSKTTAIPYTGKADVSVTEEMRKQLLQFMQYRALLFTRSRPCVILTDRVCLIEVPVILLPDQASGTVYCVALFPEEVSLGPAPSTEKTIVWSLIPPSSAPAGTTFTFFDDKAAVSKAPGIIVLSDGKKQLHDGTLGDGTVTPPDPTKYLIKHRHKVKNVGVYIPVVVRTDNPGAASEKVSVCGTPDPRIAND